MLARALGLNPTPPPPNPTPPLPPPEEQVPITISRLKDFATGSVTRPAVVMGEAIKDNGGGEYDFTDGTAVKELELKGDTRSVSLNTCYLIIGNPTGSDLEVTDGHHTDHAVVALGVRCPNGIDDL